MDPITRIEETLAHQSAQIDDLSDVVRRQQAEIDRLTRRVALLLERAAESEAATGGSVILADQKPPHY